MMDVFVKFDLKKFWFSVYFSVVYFLIIIYVGTNLKTFSKFLKKKE